MAAKHANEWHTCEQMVPKINSRWQTSHFMVKGKKQRKEKLGLGYKSHITINGSMPIGLFNNQSNQVLPSSSNLCTYTIRTLCLNSMAMATDSYYYHSSKPHRRACRRPSLRRRCLTMVKQQKTRFYILGRCVSMLLCWHVHDMSD